MKFIHFLRFMIPFFAMFGIGFLLDSPAPYKWLGMAAWMGWGFVYFYDNPPWKKL